MAKVQVKMAGSNRMHLLDLPSKLQVHMVHQLISDALGLQSEGLKLVLKGRTLQVGSIDQSETIELVDGDTIIGIVAPKPPPQHLQNRFSDEDEDEELRFSLPEGSNRYKKHLATFLRDKLRIPDILLMAIFSVSTRAWVLGFFWFLCAPIAHRWDLGPLYVLTTAFCLILFNLGSRQEGEISAYSIFNEGFQEIPGTLNADRLDRDIRAGLF